MTPQAPTVSSATPTDPARLPRDDRRSDPMSSHAQLPPRPPTVRRPAITPADGGLKHRPNIYTHEDFFRHDPTAGSHRRHDGQRTVLVTADFLGDLAAGLAAEFGEESSFLVYKCGFEWGLQDMKRFSQRMRQGYGGGRLDLWQMPRRFVLENWWLSFGVQGWGDWTLDLSLGARQLTVVDLKHAALAPEAPSASAPQCHLYAGLLAGMMSFYDRAERQAVELHCRAHGHPSCKFLVGPAALVERARAARADGLAATEILRQLA